MKKTNFTSILPKWSWQSGVTRWLTMAVFVIVGLSGAVAQVGPNCQDVNLSVGGDDTARIRASEFIPNIDDAGTSSVVVENQFGGILYSTSVSSASDVIALQACSLIGETLNVTVSNSSGTCWSNWTFKQGNGKNLQSNLDTAVWCLDPLASLDPNDLENLAWYNIDEAPYTVLPTATVACGTDVVFPGTPTSVAQVRDWYAPKFEDCGYYALDWVVPFQCGESDTTKIIIREWEAYDSKTNTRTTTTDTIVFHKLPQLEAGNFYAPQKDTASCYLDTSLCNTTTNIVNSCWKQLVGLHNEGTYVYYPKAGVDASIAASIAAGDATEDALEAIKVIRRGSASYDLFDIDDLDVVIYNSDSHYVWRVAENDRFYSNGGEYITADDNWFYQAGEHGFWVDLCFPTVSVSEGEVIVDQWQDWACEEGVQVILPASPTDSTCIALCLDDDALESSKCFTVVHSEIKDLGGSCPRTVKKHFEIKQLCFSAPLVCSDSALIEAGLEVDTTGVLSAEVVGGSNTIEIEQWKLYIDTLAPLFVYNTNDCDSKSSTTAYTWSTGSHGCYSEVQVPSIKLLDNCSNVKFAKATVYPLGSTPGDVGNGWVNLTEGEDGVWSHEGGRTFRLSCGEYGVYYEYGDACHNTASTAYFRINVVDNIAPVVLTDDEVRLSIGSDEIWLDAEALDQGSYDNCGVRTVLARRTDWKSACGVELCGDVTPASLTSSELDAAIYDALNDNEVESAYAEMYRWLIEDNDWCAGKSNYVLDGWRRDIVSYWAENCGTTDAHGNPTLVVDNSGSIGGGWGTSIPFCCADACQPVTVEVLVIDKECNYSKGWVTVLVEDKSPIVKGDDFEEITITCSSYSANYAELVNAVAGTNSAENADAFAALDEALGALAMGSRGATGEVVDSEGNEIATSFTYQTTDCEDSIVSSTVQETLHDGTVVETTVFDTFVVIRDVEKTAGTGTAFVTCAGTQIQDVWVNLNDCGVGTITRRWRLSSGCSDAHESNPQVCEQTISIVAGCELEKNMFTGLSDADTIFGSLDRNTDGNLVVSSGTLMYTLDDLDCRQLGISSEDQVFAIEGQENAYKVHRTWTVTDWCAQESFTCPQKFVLITNAESRSAGTVTGTIASSIDGGLVQQVEVAAKLSSGEVINSSTSTNGSFSFDVAMGESIEIAPAKNINVLNGVDVGDIIQIQSHILGKSSISDDFKLAAADINNDGIINSKDIVGIRQVTLRKTSSFPNNTSWRFFSEVTGEESYKIESLESAMEIDFIGVKVGDVDGRDVDLARSANAIEFTTNVSSLAAGVASIELTSDVELAGYQFAIKYNPALIDVTGISGDDITSANWNKVSEGLVLVSYSGDAQSLSLDLVAHADVELSKALTITNTNDFNSVGYTAANDVAPVSFAVKAAGDFALFQNAPNPAINGTAISFNLAADSDATLTFFDVNGRVLNTIVGSYSAGLNTVNVQAADLGTVGVVYYQLETLDNTATKRMVVIK